MHKKVGLLRGLPIFLSLTDKELNFMAAESTFADYKPQAVIFEKGDVSKAMFIIESGEVKILHYLYDNKENVLARFVAGEIFGEQDLFENDPRTAMALAETPARLLVFPAAEDNFSILQQKDSVVFSKIYQSLLTRNAGRIRNTNKLISEKSNWISELKEQMLVDKLTGLYNRSFLDEEFIGGQIDYGKHFCLAAIKPDKFKQINDTYGHQAGDGILKLISDAIKGTCEKQDVPIRYRGNEFIVLFPNQRLQNTREKIGKFLEAASRIDVTPLTGGVPFDLTFSFGLAAFPEHGTDRNELVQKVFAKLFELWNQGGNGIMVADENLEQTIEFLKTIEIFSSLPLYELQTINGYLNPLTVQPGHILCREGDRDEDLFIIKKGKVSIRILLIDGEEKEVACFVAGNFFGEMALFEDAPRSATAIAMEESDILLFYKKDFQALITKSPDIGMKIMQKMLDITSDRLSNTSQFLSDMVRWGDEARRRAITDDLTGIYNRRYLETALDEKFARARRNSSCLSLVMGDLDFFREVNEGYGHETGDKYIIEVTKVFKTCLRESDVAARYGGDEFVLLFPETDSSTVFALCENIRKAVASLDFLKDHAGPEFHLAISLGIAVFPEHASNLKTLKELADKALYSAKEGGRNRVVMAAPAVE